MKTKTRTKKSQRSKRRRCAQCRLRLHKHQALCPRCKNPISGAAKSDAAKRRKAYSLYISESPAWKEKRRLVIERESGLCQRCKNPGNQVHHLTYRRLFNEDLNDLELLCVGCHHEEHPQWKTPEYLEAVSPENRALVRLLLR